MPYSKIILNFKLTNNRNNLTKLEIQGSTGAGSRIIESIPFGTQPVRTAVQTGHCLNKCSGSVTSERLIKLDVVYTAVQKRDCLNSCLYSHSSEKP